MTDLKKAAQQALEALKAMQSYAAAERKGLRICDESITALKAALEQPQQAVPYAVWRQGFDAVRKYKEQPEQEQPVVPPELEAHFRHLDAQMEQEPVAWPEGYEPHELPADYTGKLWIEGQVRRLYEASPPRREWRGLSEEEIDQMAGNTVDAWECARATEAALRSKNHE